VVCVGASTVRGSVSFNWVDELAGRLRDREWINAGVNGETSAQVLARLDEVVACRPNHVVVHVGANDVLRRLPLDAYRTNLTAIVDRLRAETDARIALMSIQVVGDLPDSDTNRELHPVHEVIRQTAAAAGAGYLPLHERMTDLLREHPGARRAMTGSPAPIVLGIVARLGLGVGLERIRVLNGFAIHTDGLHLAERAGRVAADMVEEFVLR
jgi:acyl-CoA thioesterase-1